MSLVFMVDDSRLKCMLPLIQCTLLYTAVSLIKVVTRKTRPPGAEMQNSHSTQKNSINMASFYGLYINNANLNMSFS